jgi:hypothetical protein
MLKESANNASMAQVVLKSTSTITAVTEYEVFIPLLAFLFTDVFAYSII